ncbi:hypothetical protein [Streptomyces sp. NPDC059994]|uniref:hypothetical protein n=1 Tax=Streptomyces sp. NPDC059994 TaxID=3347029 RepID=UPI0036916261
MNIHSQRPSTITVLLIASAIGATAACSTSQDDHGTSASTKRSTHPDPSTPVPSAPPSALPGPALPIQAYMPSPRQIGADGRARAVLITQCLKRFGITSGQITSKLGPRGPESMTQRRYGISDRATAAQYGYWLPGDDRNPPQVPQPSQAETQVASGAVPTYKGQPVPEGGCAGEAVRTLDGKNATAQTYGNALRAANVMELSTFNETRKDPKVKKAEQAWAACMKAKGHHVPADVFAAADRLHLPEVRPRPKPGDREVIVAVADAECHTRTDIDKIWNSLETTYQKREISNDPKKWEGIRHIYQAHFATVDKVLTTHDQGRP